MLPDWSIQLPFQALGMISMHHRQYAVLQAWRSEQNADRVYARRKRHCAV